MTDRTAFLTAFKRLTRDGSGNAIVAWHALDQAGAVLDYGMNNAAAIWASRPGGCAIEIGVEGHWVPVTDPETRTGPTQDNAEPAKQGNSAMDQDCAEARCLKDTR